MSLFEALVLGIVQGLTEFLPVSSTAHLRIVPALLGWKDPGAAYSAVIQLGTVAAVLVYFAKDLSRLTRAFIQDFPETARLMWQARFRWWRLPPATQLFKTLDSRVAWCVGLGTIPIGIFGLLFKKHIETSFRSLYIIAASLMVLAVVLAIVEKVATHRRTMADITVKDGLVIGLWQAVALIPGSSRSGTTLTGALALGFKREDAARFSFLLSIPATTLAGVSELFHLLKATDHPSAAALVVGTVVSFGSGMLAIAGLLRLLRTHTAMVFVIYRLALGALLLVLLQTGHLAAAEGISTKPPAAHDAAVASTTGQFEIVERGGNLGIQIFSSVAVAPAAQWLTPRLKELGGWWDGQLERAVVYTVPYPGNFEPVETVMEDAVRQFPELKWAYANVYDAEGKPLNWWMSKGGARE